jgi:uncharacterized RmlC-like cupin family protein
MLKSLLLLLLVGAYGWSDEGILPGGCIRPQQGQVIAHEDLKEYCVKGTLIQGVSTRGLGAQEFEMWRVSLDVGSATESQVYTTEEVVMVLRGEGSVLMGEEEWAFEGPCTIICPAYVPHSFINLGEEPTDAIHVLGTGAFIYDERGVLDLPWRGSKS